MISFIVSVLDRPHFLNACLASLAVQDGENEPIVCDNGKGSTSVDEGIPAIAMRYNASYEWTMPTCTNCYESANIGASKATGEWLCFPSDDSLYVCKFSEIMLRQAERSGADLVYCDCVYRKGETGNPSWADYSVLDVKPQMGRIDKTCFIVKRDIFLREGFKPHPRGWSDGQFIQTIMAQGVKHTKASGVLVVHQ